MISLEAVDLMPGDFFYDGMNQSHEVVSRIGNCDDLLVSGISFVVRTGSNQFVENFSRHERLFVSRVKIKKV